MPFFKIQFTRHTTESGEHTITADTLQDAQRIAEEMSDGDDPHGYSVADVDFEYDEGEDVTVDSVVEMNDDGSVNGTVAKVTSTIKAEATVSKQ